ncbi:MAG TPA: L-ribulose-5-phosphate 4-epimerase AraD [Candidatus Dormibacteraeota bacterium]|nr:L-ribulose-5-phosphate 4-epimerase AraD [Candidatus Dormibacteraeota bacterium]
MRVEKLREEVLEANLELVRRGLALYTFGNASGISRDERLVVIKPSGVPYDQLKVSDLVVTDLDGGIVEGKLRPSSDLPTHLALYRAFSEIGGVSHTHSEFATAWAQAGRAIPCLGTTHADSFHGSVPVTDSLESEEVISEYEKNTGHAIVRAFGQLDPMRVPAVLVRSHGTFCWGPNAQSAATNCVILETVARMAYYTVGLMQTVKPIPDFLHDKHFLRKHGKDRYYGQDTTQK